MKSESPIQTLPREIIGEIILHALGHYHSDGHQRRPAVCLDIREGPWVYGQVCRFWRQETLQFPSMWTNIRLDHMVSLLLKWYPQCPAATNRLETLLSRSTIHPLDVEIGSFEAGDQTERMLELLVSHSPRWRSLTLLTTQSLAIQISKMVMKDLVPSLQSIDIENDPRTTPLDATELDPAFLYDAPNLRRVSLTHLTSIDKLNLPWWQITHFRVHGSRFPDGPIPVDVEILNVMPNLVWFEAKFFDDSNPTGPIIIPSNLRSVGLGFVGEGFSKSKSKSSRLRLPQNLNTLHIAIPFVNATMKNLVQESGCDRIETLVLGDYVEGIKDDDDSAILVQWLAELTTVKTLELRGYDADDLFRLLRTHDPPLLPNLQTIRFCSSASLNCTFVKTGIKACVVDLLKVRIPKGLKELCYSGSFRWHTEVQSRGLEKKYLWQLGEYVTSGKFRVSFRETDIWGDPVY